MINWNREDDGVGEADSESQFGVGASGGVRVPIAGEALKFRSELRYVYLFESEEDLRPAASVIMLTAGISAFIQ